MAYTNLGYGSQGDSVRKLQEALNSAGYSLDVDGVFGTKTQAAVRDYQQKNGLKLDGIAGEETQGRLFGTSTGNNVTQSGTGISTGGYSGGITPKTGNGLNGVSADTLANLSKYESGYTPSDAVLRAEEYLKGIQDKKPGEYQSAWTDQLNELYSKIMNRPDFQYDLSSDPTYRQYAERYKQMGQQAMMDTQGQAAALTGGYGSSYGQSVGQQQYQAFLQQLNDIVPQLEQAAYERYRDEGNDMVERYALTQQRDESDYGRYRDDMNQYNTELASALQQANFERDFDYTDFANMLAYYQQKAQQENSDYWSAAQLAYQRERDAIADAQWQAEFNLAQQQAASKSSGGSGGSSGGGKSSGGDAVDIPDSAIISNRHNESSGWIEVGGSRWTYQEVLNGVNSGKFIETYDPKTNKVTYKKA